MRNFTEEIKNEITSRPLGGECCRRAALAAFIRTSGSIISDGGNFGFEIVTENGRTAEFFADIAESLGLTASAAASKYDLLSGKDKHIFSCADENSEALLKRLGIVGEDEDGKFVDFGISGKLLQKKCCKTAFLKGAFLGGGSCTIPDENSYSRTGYHFEIVFSNKITANDFCELLCGFDILAKLVSRKDAAVVYVKSKEVISDLLHFMSAPECLAKLNKIVELKDKTNNLNRVNNCSVSNIDKTVTASVNQVRAIEIISETVGLQSLDKGLFDVAECRLADKNASMQELSDRLHISKSCLNHRMRRIIELAKTLQD